mgnify:FL=1
MGSGKSSLGCGLAKRLKWKFVDTDKAIEQQQGQSILDIFETKGEEHFRELERAYIQSIDSESNQIIAVGGGMPCFFDNMEQLNLKGTTIYLHRPPGELVYRLQHSKNPRPLVVGKSTEELNLFVHEALTYREQFYKRAHYQVSRKIGSATRLHDFLVQEQIILPNDPLHRPQSEQELG